MPPSHRRIYLAFAGAAIAGFLLLSPPIAQDPGYHNFADARTILGVPNFWNTLSNLGFAAVAVLGWRRVRGAAARLLMLGVLLTAVGSGYYHLAPDDARLVWDRLPMTIVFMALTTLAVAPWFPGLRGRGGNWLLIALTAFGIASVAWWVWSGDLRLYAIAQFGPVLLLVPAVLSDPRLRGLWPALVWYALAKLAEAFDGAIYRVLPLSGHTLKHLFAAAAVYWIWRWIVAGDSEAVARPG